MHIGIQAKGVLVMRIVVHGRAAHSSTPWLGDNAVLKAVDVFRAIETLPFSRESSEMFDRPSINLGRIEGGDALNKVPDRCEMAVDVRYLPGQDPGEILAQVRAIPEIDVRRTFIHPPVTVSRTDLYVQRAARGGGALGPRAGDAQRRPGRRLRCRLVHRGRDPGGRVRGLRRRAPRTRRVGLAVLADALPGCAGGLRGDAAGPAGAVRGDGQRTDGDRGRAAVRLMPRTRGGALWRFFWPRCWSSEPSPRPRRSLACSRSGN